MRFRKIFKKKTYVKSNRLYLSFLHFRFSKTPGFRRFPYPCMSDVLSRWCRANAPDSGRLRSFCFPFEYSKNLYRSPRNVRGFTMTTLKFQGAGLQKHRLPVPVDDVGPALFSHRLPSRNEQVGLTTCLFYRPCPPFPKQWLKPVSKRKFNRYFGGLRNKGSSWRRYLLANPGNTN